MLSYQLERWPAYFADCQALWLEHYDEIAVQKERMAMKPDVESYERLDAAGILHILTVREGATMVGYLISIIRPHMHYADVLCGFEDSYFLSKPFRRGPVGVRLIREGERHMREAGVEKAFFMTKIALNKGRIFEFLGYTQSDAVYAKWIGD